MSPRTDLYGTAYRISEPVLTINYKAVTVIQHGSMAPFGLSGEFVQVQVMSWGKCPHLDAISFCPASISEESIVKTQPWRPSILHGSNPTVTM